MGDNWHRCQHDGEDCPLGLLAAQLAAPFLMSDVFTKIYYCTIFIDKLNGGRSMRMRGLGMRICHMTGDVRSDLLDYLIVIYSQITVLQRACSTCKVRFEGNDTI